MNDLDLICFCGSEGCADCAKRTGGNTASEWLTSAEVAALLGVSTRSFQCHRKDRFGWLPVPALFGDRALRWPAVSTRAAIARGKPDPKPGETPLDGFSNIYVLVPHPPAVKWFVQILALPEDKPGTISAYLDFVEVAIHDQFGRSFVISTNSPAIAGTWELLPADPD